MRRIIPIQELNKPAFIKSTLLKVCLIAFLILLISIFFNKMVFSNLIFARGDTFLYFYPYWQAAADALRDGRIPLWNPNLFMGAPFLANSQAGFFYPLNWPLWYLLSVPQAIKVSVFIHLIIAAWGTYLAGRKILSLNKIAALFAAVLFALGGYLTAQVEHINQLQGLAWLPWFWVVTAFCGDDRPKMEVLVKGGVAFGLLFSLQIMAGHTQTAFITGISIIIWSLAQFSTKYLTTNISQSLRFSFYNQRFRSRFPTTILLGLGLTLCLTAVQLLPTLELAQQSSRQGGLPFNEVLSFSLHPLLLTRSLLPAYDQAIFSEYTAFLPVTAIMLAVIGGWQWRRLRGVFPLVMLVIISLVLGSGYYIPVNWIIGRLPFFNFFRVPARWLVLYALSVSLLAGLGLQFALDRYLVQTRKWSDLPGTARENLWHIERPLRYALMVVLGLMIWGVIANILAVFIPTGPEAPYQPANLPSLLIWLVEILLVFMLLSGQNISLTDQGKLRISLKRGRLGSPILLVFVSVLVLYLSSRSQPYNHLTTPEAYFDLRPSLARLKALASCEIHSSGTDQEICLEPAPRLLSLSDTFFDPGDQEEINAVYKGQLPETTLYDYTIAIKQKEIIAPNLPLAYGLSSVDGFDGGILPLRSYTKVMQLILPEGVTTTDGRLRELLSSVPENRWLDLFNTRYIITDKVGDSWRQGVFFDLQHPVNLTDNETISVGYVPPFEATALLLIASNRPGDVEVLTVDGQTWRIIPELIEEDFFRFDLPRPAILKNVTLSACGKTSCQLSGLSMFDVRDNSFYPLVIGEYRMIHSGDVKIYQNLDSLPRVFLVTNWEWQADIESSLSAMDHPDFNISETAVLLEDESIRTINPDKSVDEIEITSGKSSDFVNVQRYEPERIIIEAYSATKALLVMSDAFYPGWKAVINGESSPIYQADVMFRGVIIPPGQHLILFTFEPESYQSGLKVTLIGFAGLFVSASYALWIRLRKG